MSILGFDYTRRELLDQFYAIAQRELAQRSDITDPEHQQEFIEDRMDELTIEHMRVQR